MSLGCLPTPRKDVPRVISFSDRLDQIREGLFAFTIRDRRVYAKEAVETIRGIFDSRGLARRGPGHDFPYTVTSDAVTVVGDNNVTWDPGDPQQGGHEGFVLLVVVERREWTPSLVEKFDPPRCQELLQCPASRKPWFLVEILQGRRAGEVDDAEVGVGVPFVHGVNCLAKFGRIVLVDTASIRPDEFVSYGACCLTELHELGKTGGLGAAVLAQTPGRARSTDVFIARLAGGPAMRKDSVFDDVADGLSEGQPARIDVIARLRV